MDRLLEIYIRWQARQRARLAEKIDLIEKYAILRSLYSRPHIRKYLWFQQLGDTRETNLTISEKPLDKSAQSGTIKVRETLEDGGPGSGNFGHKGVPGQVGGSAPSDGSSSEGVTKSTAAKSVKAFKRTNGSFVLEADKVVRDQGGRNVLLKSGSTVEMVTDFAGPGLKREYRGARISAEDYGGRPLEWTKAKGMVDAVLPSGIVRKAEIHWVEHPEHGRHDVKVKRYIKDEKEVEKIRRKGW